MGEQHMCTVEDDGNTQKVIKRCSVSPTNALKVKYCGLGSLLTCCFVFLVLLAVLIPMGILLPCNKSYDTPDQDSLIRITKEYQVTLNVSLIDHRADFIDQWVKVWNEASQFIQVDGDSMKTYTRTQWYLDATVCGSDLEFRVRHYDNGKDNTTIDIKSSDTGGAKTCHEPLWPRSKYLDNSTQKCEIDVHDKGYDKYCRESRVKFDEYTDFETCGELADLFPWAFEDLRPFEWDIPVPILERRGIQYWWLGSFKGEEQGVKYKFSSTLRYHTIQERVEDNGPSSGEWSIRVYSNDEGYSDDWNEEVVDDVSNAFEAIADVFSKYR